jgi:hypothetical protein
VDVENHDVEVRITRDLDEATRRQRGRESAFERHDDTAELARQSEVGRHDDERPVDSFHDLEGGAADRP